MEFQDAQKDTWITHTKIGDPADGERLARWSLPKGSVLAWCPVEGRHCILTPKGFLFFREPNDVVRYFSTDWDTVTCVPEKG